VRVAQDPTVLVDSFVVIEVGVRQAWPFIGFSDPRSGAERRLYLDGEGVVTRRRQRHPSVGCG
jgi:hypothetical protein